MLVSNIQIKLLQINLVRKNKNGMLYMIVLFVFYFDQVLVYKDLVVIILLVVVVVRMQYLFPSVIQQSTIFHHIPIMRSSYLRYISILYDDIAIYLINCRLLHHTCYHLLSRQFPIHHLRHTIIQIYKIFNQQSNLIPSHKIFAIRIRVRT